MNYVWPAIYASISVLVIVYAFWAGLFGAHVSLGTSLASTGIFAGILLLGTTLIAEMGAGVQQKKQQTLPASESPENGAHEVPEQVSSGEVKTDVQQS
jgi:hypothetical protein